MGLGVFLRVFATSLLPLSWEVRPGGGGEGKGEAMTSHSFFKISYLFFIKQKTNKIKTKLIKQIKLGTRKDGGGGGGGRRIRNIFKII